MNNTIFVQWRAQATTYLHELAVAGIVVYLYVSWNILLGLFPKLRRYWVINFLTLLLTLAAVVHIYILYLMGTATALWSEWIMLVTGGMIAIVVFIAVVRPLTTGLVRYWRFRRWDVALGPMVLLIIEDKVYPVAVQTEIMSISKSKGVVICTMTGQIAQEPPAKAHIVLLCGTGEIWKYNAISKCDGGDGLRVSIYKATVGAVDDLVPGTAGVHFRKMV